MSNLNQAKLVTVAWVPDEPEASILVSTLQENGIRATATGGFTAGFRAEAPGMVQVQTFESDAEAARRILDELKQADGLQDWAVEENET